VLPSGEDADPGRIGSMATSAAKTVVASDRLFELVVPGVRATLIPLAPDTDLGGHVVAFGDGFVALGQDVWRWAPEGIEVLPAPPTPEPPVAPLVGSDGQPFVPALPASLCRHLAPELERRMGHPEVATERPEAYAAMAALLDADISARWDEAGVCVHWTGDTEEGQFRVDVVEGTLSDDLRAETEAAIAPASLVIDVESWPQTPRRAFWRLAPGAAPDPAATELTVQVTERACAGGASAEGRIPAPTVEESADAVTITISVVALPGEPTCDPNPPTPYTVVLDEPLGDRTLVGAGGPGL
jgi:hypothetical protein